MQGVMDFVAGPLFRLTFAIMLLGLLRIFVLTIWGMLQAYHEAGDKVLPIKLILGNTIGWLVPVLRLWKTRPIYSFISFIFHIGLILVPIFLLSHIQLWRDSIGFGWPALSNNLADILTIITMIAAVALFLGRITSRNARFISRPQDFIWPLLLAAPFVTGYVCNNARISASLYQWLMLAHMLSAELIFVMMPFTKIAHCVLVPLSQLVSNLGWKFPAQSGEGVAETLGKKEMPI
jgi:nitrate reductase gamma subunit